MAAFAGFGATGVDGNFSSDAAGVFAAPSPPGPLFSPESGVAGAAAAGVGSAAVAPGAGCSTAPAADKSTVGCSETCEAAGFAGGSALPEGGAETAFAAEARSAARPREEIGRAHV